MATPDEEYWAACERGTFMLQQCENCSTWLFPPIGRCSNCLSVDLARKRPSGRGTVWSWIRMHRPYFKDDPTLQPPYEVAMIELDEGVRMIASVDGLGANVDIGATVQVYVDERATDGARRLPRFRVVQ